MNFPFADGCLEARPLSRTLIDRGSGRIVDISSIIGEMGNIGPRGLHPIEHRMAFRALASD